MVGLTVLVDRSVPVSGREDLIDMSSAVEPGIGGSVGILFLSKEEALWDVNGRGIVDSAPLSSSGAVRDEEGRSWLLSLRVASSKPNAKPAARAEAGARSMLGLLESWLGLTGSKLGRPGSKLGRPGSKLGRNVGSDILSKHPVSVRALSGGVPGNTGSCHPNVGPERPAKSCDTL